MILGIAMELCRNGTLFRQIETARAISNLPPQMLHQENGGGGMLPRNARERDLMVSFLRCSPPCKFDSLS